MQRDASQSSANLRVPMLVLGIALLCGCRSPVEPGMSRIDLYRLHCSGCHGDGTGNGHIAETLKTRPRNLKHREWQTSVTDSHIIEVIRNGGATVKLSSEMPAFGEKLSDSQIEQLAAYIRQLGR